MLQIFCPQQICQCRKSTQQYLHGVGLPIASPSDSGDNDARYLEISLLDTIMTIFGFGFLCWTCTCPANTSPGARYSVKYIQVLLIVCNVNGIYYNTMDADDPMTQRTRLSTAMVLTYFTRSNPTSAPKLCLSFNRDDIFYCRLSQWLTFQTNPNCS